MILLSLISYKLEGFNKDPEEDQFKYKMFFDEKKDKDKKINKFSKYLIN